MSSCSAIRGYGEVSDEDGLLLLEVCAGCHRITTAAQEFGMPALAMDAPRLFHMSFGFEVTYSRHMDLMTGLGWLVLLNAARKLRPGGLLWAGCPCSTWVWLSRGLTGRSRLRVRGHARRATLVANRLIRRLCYVLLAFDCLRTSGTGSKEV